MSVALTLALAESSSILIEHAFPFYSAAFGASAIILDPQVTEHSAFQNQQGPFAPWRFSWPHFIFDVPLSLVGTFRVGFGRRPAWMAIVPWCLSYHQPIVVAALMYTGVEAPILAARPHFRDQPRDICHNFAARRTVAWAMKERKPLAPSGAFATSTSSHGPRPGCRRRLDCLRTKGGVVSVLCINTVSTRERCLPRLRRRFAVLPLVVDGCCFVRSLGFEHFPKLLICLVQLGGLEPPGPSCSTDRRSNQLSYNCVLAGCRKRGAERGGN